MGRCAQGDLGELSAAEWFARQGWQVYAPLTHAPDVDLVVLRGTVTCRVQVKTSSCLVRERWEVSICTRGGNRSWDGRSRLFSPSRCDVLFVLVADGRRWCIPAGDVDGGQGIMLGGPKYARFEIERGLPFDVRAPASAAAAAAFAERLSL